MKRLVSMVSTILVLVVLAAASCAEKEPAVTPGEEEVSTCVGCHSDKDLLKELASPEKEETSGATSGEG
ncbi:hypothetical protein ACFLXG_02410 [Chloroflexota bacterium]